MAEERARISAFVTELRKVSEADDSQENRKARLGLVSQMLMAYPTANATEESAKARGSAYLASLDDVPPWAIAEAIRRWHRGEGGGKDANYRFGPAPAELRYAATQILQPARQTIAHLEAVLSALTIDRAMDPTPLETKPGQPRLKVIR